MLLPRLSVKWRWTSLLSELLQIEHVLNISLAYLLDSLQYDGAQVGYCFQMYRENQTSSFDTLWLSSLSGEVTQLGSQQSSPSSIVQHH